ncbi:MAG TPA: FAD-dependent oxidoreductase [Enteractinococcus sp.]
MNNTIVIIGAGQAGLTVAMSLRDKGWTGQIHLVSAEDHIPYQRPPLSKGYLAGTETGTDLALTSPQALFERDITGHFGTAVLRVDREKQQVDLSDGKTLSYNKLIFATGSQPRDLEIPGSELIGIHTVRTTTDADLLRASFAEGGDTVFIGGGFLNLEVAVEALKYGAVTVLEVAPQILGRVLSLPAANALADYHASLGIDIRCGVTIERILGDSGRVTGVELGDSTQLAATRIVVSIGAVARDELAAQAGLATDRGIVVDQHLRTSDPDVFAIGDCAVFPSIFAGSQMRIESVQNATDQARHVAEMITGSAESGYQAVPWFWSVQGERRLQIAGLASPEDEAQIVEQDPAKGKLVVERLRNGEVVAVETINAPGPHMKARRALASTAPSGLQVSM